MTRAVSSVNAMMWFELCVTAQSWVRSGNSKGLSKQPWGAPVFNMVLLEKPRIQLQRMVLTQLIQILYQLLKNDGVECWADEKHSDRSVLRIQMCENQVNSSGDGITCRAVGTIRKLHGVQCDKILGYPGHIDPQQPIDSINWLCIYQNTVGQTIWVSDKSLAALKEIMTLNLSYVM